MMRFKSLLFFPLLAALISGCGDDMDFDMENLDREVTLFEEEISVPFGDIGPITFQNTLGDAVSSLLTVDDEGLLWAEDDRDIYTVSAYEIATKMEDADNGGEWTPGSHGVTITGIAFLFRLFGVKCLNQSFEIYLTNPLKRSVDVSADVRATYSNSDYVETEAGVWHVDELVYSRTETKIAEVNIPSDILEGINEVNLDNIVLTLPKGWTSQIPENANTHFTFRIVYKTNVAFAGNFTFEQTIPLRKVKLGIGQFNLKGCDITTNIENAFPVGATLTSLKALKEGGKEVNENVSISHDIHIAAGSRDVPSITPATFHVEALVGTIPDITGIELGVRVNVADMTQASPLYMEQGITLKDIKAKATGGITIDLNKKKDNGKEDADNE